MNFFLVLASISCIPLFTPVGQNEVLISGNGIITQEQVINSGSHTQYAKITVQAPINELGKRCFYECKNLETIILPNTIEKIGIAAFRRCYKLKNFTVPPLVTRIEDETFMTATELTSIIIHEFVSFIAEKFTFYNAYKLTEFIVSESSEYFSTDSTHKFLLSKDGLTAFHCVGSSSELVLSSQVKTIGNYFANGMTGITKFIFDTGSELTAVNDSAFRYTSITKMIFPSKLLSLGPNIFDSSSIENVSIPSSLEVLDPNTFNLAANLSRIDVNKDNQILSSEDGVLYDKDLKSLIFIPPSKRSFEIPGTVLSISGTVIQYSRLSEINVSSSNKKYSAENNLLYKGTSLVACPGMLEEAVVRSNCSKVDSYAFSGTMVKRVLFESLTEITFGQYAFSSCKNIEMIQFPSFLTKIDHYCFADCQYEGEIVFGSKLESIGNYGFKSSKITKADLSCTKLTQINEFSFIDTINLVEVKLPPNLVFIYEGAFSKSSITSLNFSGSNIQIGINAFGKCTKLSSVEFNDCVSTIASEAFSQCSLKSLKFQKSLSKIDTAAFKLNGKLENVEFDIESNVTSIEANVFDGCSLLTNVSLGKNVSKIHIDSFIKCPKLKVISIPESNQHFRVESGCLISKQDESLLMLIPDFDEMILTGSVQKLLKGFSKHNSIIKRIYVSKHSKLKEIPEESFCGKIELQKIYFDFNSSLLSIGENAFKGCSNLVDFCFPPSIQSIASCSFMDCTMLSNVYLGPQLQSVGEKAFSGCIGINLIIYCGERTFEDDNVFDPLNVICHVTDHYHGKSLFGLKYIRMYDSSCNIPSVLFTPEKNNNNVYQFIAYSIINSDG